MVGRAVEFGAVARHCSPQRRRRSIASGGRVVMDGTRLTPIQVNCLNTGSLARPPSVLVGLSVAAGTVLGRAYRLRHPLNAHASHDTILHNPMRPYLGQLPCRIRGAAVHAPLHGLEPNQAVLTRVLHAPRSRGAARAVSVHLRDVPPLPSTNLLFMILIATFEIHFVCIHQLFCK